MSKIPQRKYACSEKEAGQRVDQLIKELRDKNDGKKMEPIHTIEKISKILVNNTSYYDAYYAKQ